MTVASYQIDPGAARKTLVVVDDRAEVLRGTLDAYGSQVDSWGEAVGGVVAAALAEFREETVSEAAGVKGVILSGLSGVNTALGAYEAGDQEMAGTHQRALGAIAGPGGWGGGSGGVSAVSREALMFDPAAFGGTPRESAAEPVASPGQGEAYDPPVPAPGDANVPAPGDVKDGE